jgi:deoxyribodipyrimidine photo-lyase
VAVPLSRIRALNARNFRPDGAYVLYWMTACRRLRANDALNRAVEIARELGRPLVVFEGLRAGYPFASDRLHAFVIDGMAEHARVLRQTEVAYYPYVEAAPGEGRGLLDALARHAAAIVTDDYPCFFLPRMAAAAAARVPVRIEAVDSNGLLPMRAAAREFATAYSFRAHLQRELPALLGTWPRDIDLTGLPRAAAGAGGRARAQDTGALSIVDARILARWPATPAGALDDSAALAARLPIDHSVPPVGRRGGSTAGRAALAAFVSAKLARYAVDHSHPDADGTSGLSPWLHFGHLSPHEVFDAVATAERWTSRRLAARAGGKREGWWGMSAGAEAFLDQVITWREIGFNLCVSRPDDYWTVNAVPAWARATLRKHARDRRPALYAFDELDRSATADQVWNAAQRQLVTGGWMHNYLRMLWGKRILEWTASPEDALDVMARLMNRYALDGRDPNSYTGYLWTLGRYDRPWAPERDVFGTVRYMSSANTLRKLRMKSYMERYGSAPAPPLFSA